MKQSRLAMMLPALVVLLAGCPKDDSSLLDAGTDDAGPVSDADVADATPDSGPSACERACQNVYEVCGAAFQSAGGGTDLTQAECVASCAGGGLEADQVACFEVAACTDEAFGECFGGAICPRDVDCAGRSCGADPVCGESCGTCTGGASCAAEGVCASPLGWRFLPLWEGMLGDSPGIAVDPSGALHVAWLDAAGVHHARYADGTWSAPSVVEAVAREITFWQRVSVAVDATGRPHITWYDPTEQRLRYARAAEAGWQVETVAEMNVGMYAALALDGSGVPHVSFEDRDNETIVHARRAGTHWEAAVVGSIDGGLGRGTSIAIDGTNQPHIAYASVSSVTYARWNGADWVREIVSDEEADVVALALVGTNPYIAALRGRRVLLATRDGETWTVANVSDTGDRRGGLAIASASEVVHLVYADTAANQLRYTRIADGDWTHEPVFDGEAEAFGLAGECSVALDAGGAPWVLFQSPVLTVAYKP